MVDQKEDAKDQDSPFGKVQGKINTLLDKVHEQKRNSTSSRKGSVVSSADGDIYAQDWSDTLQAESLKDKLKRVKQTCEEAKRAAGAGMNAKQELSLVKEEAREWQSKCLQEEAKNKALEELLLQYMRASSRGSGDSRQKNEGGQNVSSSSAEQFPLDSENQFQHHPASSSRSRPVHQRSQSEVMFSLSHGSSPSSSDAPSPTRLRPRREGCAVRGRRSPAFQTLPASANIENLGERYHWAGQTWCESDCDDVGVEDHKLVGALVCKPSQSHSAATMSHRLGAEAYDQAPDSSWQHLAAKKLIDEQRFSRSQAPGSDCGWTALLDKTCFVDDMDAAPPPRASRVVLRCQESGVTVARGPDWKWGDQDGGANSLGITLDRHAELGCVWVQWPNGEINLYRVGAEHCFDLVKIMEATDSDVGTEVHDVEVGIFSCCASRSLGTSGRGNKDSRPLPQTSRPLNYKPPLHAADGPPCSVPPLRKHAMGM